MFPNQIMPAIYIGFGYEWYINVALVGKLSVYLD